MPTAQYKRGHYEFFPRGCKSKYITEVEINCGKYFVTPSSGLRLGLAVMIVWIKRLTLNFDEKAFMTYGRDTFLLLKLRLIKSVIILLQ